MFIDMYYMLTAFSLVFFFFALYFTWDEHIQYDRNDMEYDVNIFIAIPLSLIAIILHTVLTYSSWYIEVAYVVGDTISIYENSDMFYFATIHILLIMIHLGFLFKNAFDYYQDMAEHITGKRKKDERLW